MKNKLIILLIADLISCISNATCNENLHQSHATYIPIASSSYTKTSWKDSEGYYTEITSNDLTRGNYKIVAKENSNEFRISTTNPSAAFDILPEQQHTINFKIDESGMKVSVLYGNNQQSTNGFNLPYPAAIALRSKVIQPLIVSSDTIELVIPKNKNFFITLYYWLHRKTFSEVKHEK